jgi:hypothetical protein
VRTRQAREVDRSSISPDATINISAFQRRIPVPLRQLLGRVLAAIILHNPSERASGQVRRRFEEAPGAALSDRYSAIPRASDLAETSCRGIHQRLNMRFENYRRMRFRNVLIGARRVPASSW